jgi:hypothetical protein
LLFLLALLDKLLELLDIDFQFAYFQTVLDGKGDLRFDGFDDIALYLPLQRFLAGLAEFDFQATPLRIQAGRLDLALGGQSQRLLFLLGQRHPRVLADIGQIMVPLRLDCQAVIPVRHPLAHAHAAGAGRDGCQHANDHEQLAARRSGD